MDIETTLPGYGICTCSSGGGNGGNRSPERRSVAPAVGLRAEWWSGLVLKPVEALRGGRARLGLDRFLAEGL